MIRRVFAGVALFFVRLGKWVYLLTQKGSEPFLQELERRFSGHGHDSGADFQRQKRKILSSLSALNQLSARDVMIPRIDMVVVKVQDSVEKIVQIMIDKGKSRLPVYEGSIDNVVGIVHARDLFPVLLKKGWKRIRTGEVMRAPHFVPVSKSVDELIKEFQEKKIRLGIVIDEYGGTAGLVSFEDFLEEIVGKIRDEHDQEMRESIIPHVDGSYEVDARINLEELNQKLNTDFPTSEDYGTLGGFVVTYLGRIPKLREWFQYKGYHMTILNGDPRSVSWVRLRKI